MKKIFFILFIVPFVLQSSQFEMLMGKESPAWNFVRTNEDREKLQLFQELYEKRDKLTPQGEARIPCRLHMVWLGPDSLPKEAVAHLKKWQELHPNWEFNLWTDLDRELPLKWMKKRFVHQLPFSHLLRCYNKADNFKEKAFFLTLEILYQEGGVYVDHDVEPKASLTTWNHTLNFYAPLARLKPSIFSSSVYPESYLIASAKGHHILLSAMRHVVTHFERYKTYFPGKRPIDIQHRTRQLLYDALESGVEEGAALRTGREIFFPAAEMVQLARHHEAGTWAKMESAEQAKLRLKLGSLTKKVDFTLMLTWTVAALFAVSVLLLLKRRRRI